MGTPGQEGLRARLWNQYYAPGTAVWVDNGYGMEADMTAGPAELMDGVAVVRLVGQPKLTWLRNIRPQVYNFQPLDRPAVPALEDQADRCPGPL